MSDDLSLDDILVMYVQEAREHLESIESDLLALEREGSDSDEESINKMFRAAHSIKGGSGFWAWIPSRTSRTRRRMSST